MIRFPIVLLSILLLNPVLADTLKPRLSDTLQRILKQNRIDKEHVFFTVMDETGTVVDSYQDGDEVPLASATKLATCYYGLSKLGVNSQFETEFYLSQNNGKNRLLVVGGGDPSLVSQDFLGVIEALRIKGITKIDELSYDDKASTKALYIEDFGPMDQTYNPSLSALNLDFNRWTFLYYGKKSSEPNQHFLIRPSNSETKYNPGQKLKFESGGKETWLMKRRTRYLAQEDFPVRMPSLRTMRTFAMFGEIMGIKMPEPKAYLKKKESEFQLIQKVSSMTLDKLCRLTLEYSNNLFAEAILVKASKAKFHETLQIAADRMKSFFMEKFPNLEWQKAVMRNGSGLTPYATFTTHLFTGLVRAMVKNPIQKHSFLPYFSIAGKSGYLKSRFESSSAYGRVFAKTGSLDFANTISGVLYGKSGKPHFFTLTVYDKIRRGKMDLESLNHRRLARRAEVFRKRSLSAMDKILETWINQF